MTQTNGKVYHVHRLKLILLQYSYYQKQSTESMQSLKIPMVFFIELEQIILKCVGAQKIPNSRTNSRKKTKLEISLPDFKLYYKYIVIKIMVLAQKQTHTYQWNRLEAKK